MSEANAVIPEELLGYVADRKRLWAESERSQSDLTNLQKLSHQVPQEANAVPLDPLSAENTPPAELSDTVRELEQTVQEIQRHQRDIQAQEDEIEAINSRYRMFVYAAIALVIVLIVVLAFVVISAV